jgi:cell division protein FtsQ
MPAVAVPADKRFRRAHVKPSRRRGLRLGDALHLLKSLAVLALAAYGAWRGAVLVMSTSALEIANVSVEGNERLSTGEVLALVEGLRGRHILSVDLDEWRQRLLASPWVADATLRRSFPSTIEVVVRERFPMGIGRIGTRLYLVDDQGVIVDEYGPNHAAIDLPVIDGLASVPKSGGPLVDEARVHLAARLLNDMTRRPDLARRISQVDVSDAHNAVVILDGDTARLRLGDREFAERLQGYIDLGPALRERVAEIDYVDLRFDERLYVRPARPDRAARR